MQEVLLSILLTLTEIEDRETLRFVHSAEQGYDSSCGLTALACLMSGYWGQSSDELSLAREFLAARIAEGDFTVSFADMKTILAARGFTAAAYRMDWEQLRKASERYAPILVHYTKPEGHFALVLAADESGPIVADPASGTGAVDRALFLERWSGFVFLAALPGRSPNTAFMADAVALARGRLSLLERVTRDYSLGLTR